MTAHDPEADQTCYVEFYLTEGMGHWHTCCDQELRPGEALVLIVAEDKLQAVIRREFDNLTHEEIVKFAKLVNEAKLDDLKRWQSVYCCVRIPRSKAKHKVDGTWVLKWKKVRQ